MINDAVQAAEHTMDDDHPRKKHNLISNNTCYYILVLCPSDTETS